MRKSLSILATLFAFSCAAHSALAAPVSCAASAGNLLGNGSFQSGTFACWSGTSTTDFTSGVDSDDPFHGDKYEAYIGGDGSNDTLYETIATTPGVGYIIDFELMNDTSPSTGYTNDFSVLFGTSTLFSETAVAAGGYIYYSLEGVATSATTELEFLSRNDAGNFELDNVSVIATPEPSSFLLLGTGAAGLIGCIRRRFKA